MFDQRRQLPNWGFRFSMTDAGAIGAAAGAAFFLWRLASPLWWLLLIAAGHFFLFCNVFRIVRRRELLWATLFILNAGLWAWFDRLSWSPVLLCQTPITVAVILMDIRSPAYHGVLARRWNARLGDYLEGRTL